MTEQSIGDLLSPEEMEEIQKYIVENSEKIAGKVLQDALAKYGIGNTIAPTALHQPGGMHTPEIEEPITKDEQL